MIEFKTFQKIPRFYRRVIVTEKIDGTNGVIYVDEDGNVAAGSRNRWLTLDSDNFGFARWVHENKNELRKLGQGYHYGEWWGHGIQRGYGLPAGERRFSLFNTTRWEHTEIRPACCDVVPVLTEELDMEVAIRVALEKLTTYGSRAALGFDRPEGVVAYHTASGHLYKATIENDDAKEARHGKG